MSMRYQKGFGIPELLIGITVGMVVVAAAMSLLQVTLRSSNDNIKMARLEQELRQAMQMVSRDLRRAGWWDASMDVAKVSMNSYIKLANNSGTAVALSSPTGGDLASIGSKAIGGTLIHVATDGVLKRGRIDNYSSGTFTVNLDAYGSTWPTYVKNVEGIAPGSWNIIRPEAAITTLSNCVLMSYDNSSNGAFVAGEFFGYKRSGNTLQVRTSGAVGNDCTQGSWEDLTNSNFIEIYDFIVTESPATVTTNGLSISIREYTITIRGRLTADNSVQREMRETIKVRNDRII